LFAGNSTRPGEEVRQGGRLILHRWCQWISEYYPSGVYDGENEKLYDFNESIPWFVKDHVIKPALAQGKLVVVLGEEWHTAEAMCRLSDALYDDGLRDKVVMFWNANNTYSFHRINWPRLRFTTTITTVSRYMKHLMWQMGLNPLVIPNGISRQLLGKIDEAATNVLRRSLGAEVILFKMARWHPDKNWEGAIKAAQGLKERGLKTVLVARGVSNRMARSRALRVRWGSRSKRRFPGLATQRLSATLRRAARPISGGDVAILWTFAILYRAADAVLANSRHEPFGLGLEAMAAGAWP
jgi:glycosyltransferase involved in cell wall biosynthesis